MPEEKYDAKMVVPYWVDIKIESWDDLRKLGKNNLGKLIDYQQHSIDEKKRTIKRLNDYSKVLEGKSGEDIAEISKQYEDPIFSPKDIEIRKDSWSKKPEPVRAEDISRERGKTTFNVCGWCEYAGSGVVRYNYMIDGNCSLLSYADMEFNRDRGITTNCSLKEMGAEKIARIVGAYKTKKRGLKKEIKEKKQLIKEIKKNAELTEEKPYLPHLRPYDLFNVGDDVVVYIGHLENVITDKQFITGKVILGYRHHDGCVSFVADEPWHRGNYHKGRGGGGGASRADILPKREFEFLINNPDFLDFWLSQLKDREEKYKGFEQAIRKAAKK